MPVTIEFFGLPRHRAGVADAQLDATTVGEALRQLQNKFSALGELCQNENAARSGYLLNLNGRAFITDLTTPLHSGDTLLLFSADMGG